MAMQQAMAQVARDRGALLGPTRRDKRVAILLVAAVLAAAGVLGMVGAGRGSAAPTMPTNPAIEAQWGVRISRVAVTADGGIVDVRFVVLDPDKAISMMKDPANLPVLHPAGAQVVVDQVAQMAVRHDLNPGQTYFLLYQNAGGSVHPGGRMSITFGGLVLPDVVAE
jgi:hypothetical protein